ncbi:S41 family peptidase [Mycoplasma zalophidermidis]|uniref:Tail specific protease domain-containing protein n=1 Tax=Mycoplasma zalophidermidis TaxID=398174 RepID=A0ABS6DRF3_9MOLU|nr:S41 family peptidase [Mycoplasma zalophidermidis]MBU4689651.1 hypothetical protein [Mycoplasma zalophidermidis]MBU4693551.1 hypothetical protein [Mycoplasma zalophidermidis]MCR8966490.1 S41 family peptidase [Mycoplasma zalophidermidis]
MKKNNYLKQLLISTAAIAGTSVISASCTNLGILLGINKNLYITKQIPDNLLRIDYLKFKNISHEYGIAKNNYVDIYRENGNEDLYVNVNQMFSAMNGFFNLKMIKNIDYNNQSVKFNFWNGEQILFDADKNKIFYTSSDAFSFLFRTQMTDYGRYIHNVDYKVKNFNDSNSVPSFELNNYNYKLYIEDSNVFIPFSLFNLMFCSSNYYNLYYNGNELIGADYEQTRVPNNYMNSFYAKNSVINTQNTRINNYNFMSFLFDNYYGLANELFKVQQVKNFDEYATKIGIKNDLLSTDNKDYNEAYFKLWYSDLNELHSRIISYSFQDKKYKNTDGKNYSQKNISYHERLKQLNALREKKSKNSRVVHFESPNTARIILDSFDVGTSSQLNSEEKWRYDSYWLMDAAIKKIRTDQRGKNIKNIILDISLNGGGSAAAMEKVLGFLTNNPINLLVQDKLSKTVSLNQFNIDTNQDSIVNKNDSYSEYKWYVLTGINTFSAANLFAHIVKTQHIATVIGNKTGGGMFSVLPTVLPDGSNVDISSTSGFSGYDGNWNNITLTNLPITENGVEPDIYLTYDDYYSPNIINRIENYKPDNTHISID